MGEHCDHQASMKYSCSNCKWITRVCEKCGYMFNWQNRCRHMAELVESMETVSVLKKQAGFMRKALLNGD